MEDEAVVAPPAAVDVAQVRELLESAARRHRRISEQVVEFGDDPHATQFPVRDARRCDYPLTPVTKRPSTAAALKAQQRRALLLSAAVLASGGGDSSNTDSAVVERDDSSSFLPSAEVPWRNQLQLHVVHLLQKLRAHPDQLRDFLLVDYEDESEESVRRKLSFTAGESGDDDELGGSLSRRESVTERLARRERVLKKRMGKNYAKLRVVFSQLHRMAFIMGETLYQQVHVMVRRSVAQGVINRQANLVRLESIYKLELRRQVTTEKLLEVVRMKDTERRKKQRRQKRDEQHVRTQTQRRKTRMLATQGGKTGESSSMSQPQVTMRSSQLWDHHTEMEPIKSAHFFKMHALERVLALEWRSRQLGGGIDDDSFSMSTSGLLSQRLVSEQTEELIHEKLMAFLYSKSRETFPVWKEPPESAFTREETLRHFKRLLPVLLTMPLFAGLTIDQLIEFARVTKWRTCLQGQKAVEQGALMDELVIVMDGKLDFKPQLMRRESKRLEATLPEPSDQSAAAESPEARSTKAPPASYFGELGMLSKTEVWKSTLFAKAPGVKMLVVSRVMFDFVLQKLFGGSKSRQLLLVAQQQRPSSSPAVGVRSHVVMSAMSPTRPYTATGAAAREKNVAASKEMQTAYLRQHLGEKRIQTCPQAEQIREQEPKVVARSSASDGEEASLISKQEDNQKAERKPFAPMKPSFKDPVQTPKAKQYPGSTIQHYPSFETPVRADGTSGSSGIAHTFRLKWAQPIAFQMESLDDSIFSEWAPSFPDTSAMVDFLSSSSLSSTCLLFEKKNVLLKENLRSVCSHHQFLGGVYSSAQREQARNGLTPSTDEKSSAHLHGTSHLSHGATFAGKPHGTSHTGTQAQHPDHNSAENGSMTLSQFNDARKKSNNNSSNNGSSRRQLHVSSSMQNVLNSSSSTSNSATVLSLGHQPFSRSSFVSESSFYTDRKGRNGNASHLSPNNEDDEGEESDDDEELDLDELAAFQAQGGDSPRKKSRANQPQTNEPGQSAAGGDGDPGGKTTRARKMALDSLMFSLSGNTPCKSKQLDQDTAKEILVKKYLRASNAAETSPVPHKSPRKHAISGLPFVSAAQTGAEVNSNAPLPLRVDLQRRMEAVLVALKMKPKAKLDLVLKYTHADYYDRFQMAVVLWEQALRYVTRRETALANLWKFELVASDPRRHFRSLSTHRLMEQKERDALFYQLNFASDVCREALAELEKQCGDRVYHEDRLYADKMKKDYTELLFDVEQERLRMIYSGVRPSVSSSDARSEQSGGTLMAESGPRTPARLSSSDFNQQSTAAEDASSKRWKRSNSVVIPTPSPHEPSSSNNNEDDQAQTRTLAVAGSTKLSAGARHQLANPQESIYVCIAERQEQEERESALEKQRQAELQSVHEESERKRRSSHGATHRMAMQVKLQRQTELNELTQRLQIERQQIATASASLAFSRINKVKRDGGDEASTDEVRRATATKKKKEAIAPDLALLQRALHHFIHRPKD